jgi:hypothetical protein
MKTITPALVLAMLYLFFIVYLILSPVYLPENFATSFSATGEPECWMNRSSYMIYVTMMGSLGIIAVVIIGYFGRYMPDKWFSLPNREYWLAPERRAETMSYFFGQMLWLACLLTVFFIAVVLSTIHANKLEPVHVPHWEFLTIIGCFVVGTLIWSLIFLLHFKRTG